MQNVSPIGWALRPLKNYAKFSGRASRAEFWWFFLLTMIIYFGALIIAATMGAGLASMNPASALVTGSFGSFMIVIALFWLLLFIPMLAVQTRRLHDTNRSGWWLGAFWLLYPVYMLLIFGTTVSMQPGAAAPSHGAALAIAIASAIFALAFFIYSIVLLVFWCLSGTKGANRFGDDPYGPDVEQVFA